MTIQLLAFRSLMLRTWEHTSSSYPMISMMDSDLWHNGDESVVLGWTFTSPGKPCMQASLNLHSDTMRKGVLIFSISADKLL